MPGARCAGASLTGAAEGWGPSGGRAPQIARPAPALVVALREVDYVSGEAGDPIVAPLSLSGRIALVGARLACAREPGNGTPQQGVLARIEAALNQAAVAGL